MLDLATRFRYDAFDAELSARTTPAEWARILVLRDHPRFLNALTRYHALIPPYFQDNIVLNKVVTEAWRFEMLVYALYLHDSHDPAEPLSGLTIANLQRLCARQRCASRGRVLAIIGIMMLGGYLTRRRSERDQRIVRLEPTPLFLGIVEGWNHRILSIIEAVLPGEGLVQAHAAAPGFGADMRCRGAEGMLAGWHPLHPFPEVQHFVARDGGWMLLLTCVAQALAPHQGRAIVPVSLDLAAFGARFGVSRSHLRRLLETAHAAGLLDGPPRNGRQILLAPRLVAAFLACMASELGYYRGHALAARQARSGDAVAACA